MPSPRRWDARLHARIGRLPTTPADGWLRRLSTSANNGRLWLVLAVLLGTRRGQLRRAAIRGIGSMWVSSALVNVVLKRFFRRGRPSPVGLREGAHRLRHSPVTSSFPSGHSASAAAF
ncbi:MAG: hypothetical protein QOJ68_1215, partial [Blastococcus sp.]|nr:hypothetical protein [Blastococcus sp.]